MFFIRFFSEKKMEYKRKQKNQKQNSKNENIEQNYAKSYYGKKAFELFFHRISSIFLDF